MSDSSDSPTKPFYARLLPNLSSYLLGITLACYLTGFVITNLYLGSLGIVNLDLLRARYILTGFLFLLFLGAIVFLVLGLIRTLYRSEQSSIWSIIVRVIFHSIQNIAILFIAIVVIAFVAGTTSNPPVGTPQISPIMPLSQWIDTAPTNVLRETLAVWVPVIVLLILIVVIVVAINPKDENGIRPTRMETLRNQFGKTTERKIRFFRGLLIIFVAHLILNTATSLLGYIADNKVSPATTMPVTNLSDGWARFLALVVLIYAVIASIMTMYMVSHSSKSDQSAHNPNSDTFAPSATNKSFDNPNLDIAATIYVVAVLIALLVPTYALGVYPNLPQQVGGGNILQVSVITSSDNLKPYFTDPKVETYLIDRTSDSSLFLLITKGSADHQVIEVTSSLIESIRYNPAP